MLAPDFGFRRSAYRAALSVLCLSSVLAAVPARPSVNGLPLYFEETGPGTFLAQSPGVALTLDGDGVRLVQGSHSIRMRLAGERRLASAPAGERLLPAPVTRFEGQAVKTSRIFERVLFANVYTGIDLIFYGRGGVLEYDFVVRPGADPAAIRFDLDGASAVLNGGALELRSGSTTVKWNPPVLYEKEGGRNIPGKFALRGNQVRFEHADYDHTKTLVVDPSLNYVSYLGSTGNETAFVAVDNQGNFFLAGPTTSQDLKVTAGAFQTAHAGQTSSIFAGDAYVAKFSSTGALVWLTYLGGKGDDFPRALAIDGSGNVVIVGSTSSRDFPLKNAFQNTYGGQGGVAAAAIGDAFVTKLDPTGKQLIYSTYFGGRLDDVAMALALDSSGNAYVGGSTLSLDFPVTSGVVQPKLKGSGGQNDFPKLNAPWFDTGDGFVAKFDPTGVLQWATYLGGSLDDSVLTVALDSSLNVYCGGMTISRDFPTSANAPKKTFGGNEIQNIFGNFGDGFVAKLNPTGTAVLYSTYIGGAGDDMVSALAVDAAGQAYLTGSTSSANFFTTPGAFQRGFLGPAFLPFTQDFLFGEAFLVQMSADGSTLQYATMLGGTGDDIGRGIALDAAGSIWISGVTSSRNFPVTADALQSTFTGGGTYDGFLFEFDNSFNRAFATYLGGSGNDIFASLAIDTAGTIYLSGGTASPDLATTTASAQKTYGGLNRNTKFKGDAFVMRLTGAAGSTGEGGGGGGTPTNGVNAIGNTASIVSGTIAPGMEFDATGLALGGANTAGTTISPAGVIGTVSGSTRLLFDGTPAPLLSSSSTRIRGFVPWNVQGKGTVQVVAEVNGQRMPALTVNVADAVPGVFTSDASGQGQALSYNSDGSANSSGSPAARENTITVYITGGGMTNPAMGDGQLMMGSLAVLAQGVSATIGGANASVVRATTIPFEVAGIIEVVLIVPDDAPSGQAPLYITVGGSPQSQDGVSVWIQ